MVQGESHQAPRGTGGIWRTSIPIAAVTRLLCILQLEIWVPTGVLMGISKELNAQHITTSPHPFPLLPRGSWQWWSWLMGFLLESLIFNSLLQSGRGWKGDSTRSHPSSARKITSYSFSWKNTWPQIHHVVHGGICSSPRLVSPPLILIKKGKDHHQPMGSVIDAHNCLGCCSFNGWSSWCSELQNNSPCAWDWAHSISPQWQVWVCACPPCVL